MADIEHPDSDQSGTVVQYENGEKWYDSEGRLHKDNGPAKVSVAGYNINYKKWFTHGVLHREGSPAVIGDDGSEKWFLNGQLHRADGPAIMHGDGSEEYWQYGRHHREGGPAVKTPYVEAWINKGKLHRSDGPALIHFRKWQQTDPYVKICKSTPVPLSNYKEAWFYRGKCHRSDGPAVTRLDGTQIWVRKDCYHRAGGPAVCYPEASEEWWLNDRLHREHKPAVIVEKGHFLFHLHYPIKDEDPRKNYKIEQNSIHRKNASEVPIAKIHSYDILTSQTGPEVTERESYNYIGKGKRVFSDQYWTKGEFISQKQVSKDVQAYEDPNNELKNLKNQRTYIVER